ncbi:hypothetical protein CEXT_169231 [Caerostris extrusa]|uniref:Uncharacterized protein n=1 Tax=Caerostris extrusa TaxID=172846 RepID=A0AAV4VLG4_CAEEX|nr:hypothetical protein CEXT_169231 [Caerostris extrusa]
MKVFPHQCQLELLDEYLEMSPSGMGMGLTLRCESPRRTMDEVSLLFQWNDGEGEVGGCTSTRFDREVRGEVCFHAPSPMGCHVHVQSTTAALALGCCGHRLGVEQICFREFG